MGELWKIIQFVGGRNTELILVKRQILVKRLILLKNKNSHLSQNKDYPEKLEWGVQEKWNTLNFLEIL